METKPQLYIRVGDKLMEAEIKNGVAVVKSTSVETPNAQGGMDVTVKVNCLKIEGKTNENKS